MLTQISTGPCGARSRPPLTGGISTGACTLVVAGALTCACDLAHLGSESGVELAYRAIRCASDLDPHPAPTPLNIAVSISETRLPYLSRTARIGGETLSGQTFYFNVSPAVSCPVLETGSPCARTVAANQDKNMWPGPCPLAWLPSTIYGPGGPAACYCAPGGEDTKVNKCDVHGVSRVRRALSESAWRVRAGPGAGSGRAV